MMPIYYVIVEQVRNPMQYAIWRIIKSIPCTIEDTQRLHFEEVAPLYEQGRQIQTFWFYREPANPLQEQALA